jgi:hypothetical protein
MQLDFDGIFDFSDALVHACDRTADHQWTQAQPAPDEETP